LTFLYLLENQPEQSLSFLDLYRVIFSLKNQLLQKNEYAELLTQRQ